MFFFLPYATDRPRRRTPWMTYALFTANCLIYLLYELPYWSQGGQGVGPFGFVPAQPELGALIRSMFSHAGPAHLAGNMLYLWLFGSVVEDVLGPLLLLAFYFGGQMGATLLDVSMAKAFAPASLGVPRVGASGAIAAVLGLSLVCFSRVRVRVFYVVGVLLFLWRMGVARVQAWFFLGVWLGMQVLGGVFSTMQGAITGEAVGGVAYWAHIGGFGMGMVLALVLGLPGRIRRRDLLSGASYGEDEGYRRYADLSEAVRRAPEDAEAWLELARAKERFNLGGDAAGAYTRAAALFLEHHEPERAGRAYQALLRYDSTFTFPAAAQFDIAVGLARAGEHRAALTALDNLLRAYPTSPEAEVALMRAGELAEKTGDPGLAAGYFESLLSRYPHSTWRDYARQKLSTLRR
jgi:membrane associated rhomboid family serine protease